MATKSFEERLRSFSKTAADPSTSSSSSPSIPPQLRNPPSNIPLKFAEAGWHLPTETSGPSDELVCDSCGVRHSGWDGESPLAVHRIKSPNCRFLNTEPELGNNPFIQYTASPS